MKNDNEVSLTEVEAIKAADIVCDDWIFSDGERMHTWQDRGSDLLNIMRSPRSMLKFSGDNSANRLIVVFKLRDYAWHDVSDESVKSLLIAKITGLLPEVFEREMRELEGRGSGFRGDAFERLAEIKSISAEGKGVTLHRVWIDYPPLVDLETGEKVVDFSPWLS
ncbi:TPA: hypothetical protein ACK3Q6_001465 [Burkholderia cepacia]|nr:hypothetical protein [Burkholderia cepacia]